VIVPLLLCAVAVGGPGLGADDPSPTSPTSAEASAETSADARGIDREEAAAALERALSWLLEAQNEDGSWSHAALDSVANLGFATETHYAWQVAASALACLALLESEETGERREALDRGLAWICSTRPAKRGYDWDIDYVWAGLYGTVVCTRAAGDERFAERGEWRERLAVGGRRYLEILERNEAPGGGWGYYDDPVYSRRPKWATSFSTALVLPALEEARALGWLEDDAMVRRGRRYVERCALPNGAYAYDLTLLGFRGLASIDEVKGSLGRIQVCNWALAEIGVRRITEGRVREGLEAFERHHRFLDVARGRPIPHEAYYYNAGYFYNFAHYYAALAIGLLPDGEREGWHARLRSHLLRVQHDDGSTLDFVPTGNDRVAGTSFLALALSLGLRPTGS